MSTIIYTSEKALPYVYMGTHRETGDYYIGYHYNHVKFNRPSHLDLGVKYFTSSKYVKECGFHNFDWIILAEFLYWEDAFDFEQDLILAHLGKPGCLNKRAVKGGIRYSTCGMKCSAKTKEAIAIKNKEHWFKKSENEKEIIKQKISKALTGRKMPQEAIEKTRKGLTGKPKSQAHREKIGNVHRGKKLTDAQKQAISERQKGKKHWAAKVWLLQCPNGKNYKVRNITEFCKTNNLAYSILRSKGQRKDTRPILKGASKGWRVLDYISRDIH